MNVSLKNTLFFTAALSAMLVLPACGEDDTPDTGTDPGDSGSPGDSDSGSDPTGTDPAGTDPAGTDPGDTDTGSDARPFVASCANQVKTGIEAGAEYQYTVCDEYFFAPDATLEQEKQDGCAHPQVAGTWTTDRCPTEGLNGSCTVEETAEIEVSYYYELPESQIAVRKSSCEARGNTWTAP